MGLLITLKAVADETRLRLLAILSRGELTVQELTAILGSGQSRISHHLRILLEAGIVSVKRQGTWAYYRLDTGNGLFRALLPAMEPRWGELPQRQGDLAGLAQILDARQRRSREFFDRHARQWDAMAETLLPVADARPALVRVVGACAVLVEIGVGTGPLLEPLARKATQVIGIDHSPAMIDQARERVRHLGLANVELRLGEMSHLPLPDGQAEVVVLNMVLHHAADPAGVFREVRRVLKRGGLLVIADLVRHEREWVREQLADQWLGFDRAELAAWLLAAGFAMQSFQTVSGRGDEQSVFILQCKLSAELTHTEKGTTP